jgi:hypothetical protein
LLSIRFLPALLPATERLTRAHESKAKHQQNVLSIRVAQETFPPQQHAEANFRAIAETVCLEPELRSIPRPAKEKELR